MSKKSKWLEAKAHVNGMDISVGELTIENYNPLSIPNISLSLDDIEFRSEMQIERDNKKEAFIKACK